MLRVSTLVLAVSPCLCVCVCVCVCVSVCVYDVSVFLRGECLAFVRFTCGWVHTCTCECVFTCEGKRCTARILCTCVDSQ